jgi:beta-galactosidase
MNCRLTRENGKTFINIDGKNLVPIAYMSYNPGADRYMRFFKSGIPFASLPLYACDGGINMSSGLRPFFRSFYLGYGKYDFSVVDEMLQLACPDGEGAYIFPRVYLDSPSWWDEANPSELNRDQKGEPIRASFASDKWREDMKKVLFDLIDYIENSPWKNKVIGYHIAGGGTEEWPYNYRDSYQYIDYSTVNLAKYRLWLKNKYGSIENLNSTWNTFYNDFGEIVFTDPVERRYTKNGILRDPKEEAPVLDFIDYHNFLVADTILYFCRAVKEYTKNSRLTGAFYGYTWMMGDTRKGLHGLHYLTNSPYIDFISSTNGFADPGFGWPMGTAAESVIMHGKLWMCEGDIRTHKIGSLKDNMPHAMPDNDYYSGAAWRGPETEELSLSALSKAAARAAAAKAGIWWFDMWGGWFDSGSMVDVIGKSVDLYKNNTDDIKSEVAVIIDENGYKYFNTREAPYQYLCNLQRNELTKSGAPFDTYLAEDLSSHDFPDSQYRVIIFLTSVCPSDEFRKSCEEKLKRGNKTLLWVYFADIMETGLIDFKVVYNKRNEKMQGEFGGVVFPDKPISCPLFDENESGYEIAFFKDSTAPCVIWKKMKTHNSVYSLLPCLPHQILTEIFRMAGVHTFNDMGDVITAGGNLVCIHAVEEGFRRIRFPRAVEKAYDALTGDEMKINGMLMDIPMKQYETKIVKLIFK